MKTSYAGAHFHIHISCEIQCGDYSSNIESQLKVIDNLKNQTGLLENDMEKYLHGVYFM